MKTQAANNGPLGTRDLLIDDLLRFLHPQIENDMARSAMNSALALIASEIAGPVRTPDQPFPPQDCTLAMERAFLRIAADAESAGWCEKAIAAALLKLAKGYALACADKARSAPQDAVSA
jgi:hypothetical protein